MAMAHHFEYERPGTLEEALTLLSRCDDAAVLAGGTELVPNMKDLRDTPGTVIDIKNIKELTGIRFDGKRLTFGALTTFSQLMESEVIKTYFPVMLETFLVVASVAIRNRATVAGNLCAAVPCLDSGPLLCAFDAEVEIAGPDGRRTMPVRQFLKGNRETALKPRKPGGRSCEILTAVSLPLPAENYGGCFIKVGRYRGEDLAQTSVQVLCLPGKKYRVAFGSVAPVPVRAEKIEALLQGNDLSDRLVVSAKGLVSSQIAPITDIRSTREYRLHMSQVILGRALRAAEQRFDGRGPAYGTLFI